MANTVVVDDKQEKINGIIYNMSPSPHYRHGEVMVNIVTLLKIQSKDSLCRVFGDNIDVYNKETDDYVIPDVSIVCDTNNFKHGRYYGVPKFVVEILSPSTRLKDLTVKKDFYARLGVEEYWIVDYKAESLDVYYLEKGCYVLKQSYALETDAESDEYNAKQSIILRTLPHIKVELGEIFE